MFELHDSDEVNGNIWEQVTLPGVTSPCFKHILARLKSSTVYKISSSIVESGTAEIDWHFNTCAWVFQGLRSIPRGDKGEVVKIIANKKGFFRMSLSQADVPIFALQFSI